MGFRASAFMASPASPEPGRAGQLGGGASEDFFDVCLAFCIPSFALVTLAAASMIFTLGGCPDAELVPQKMA